MILGQLVLSQETDIEVAAVDLDVGRVRCKVEVEILIGEVQLAQVDAVLGLEVGDDVHFVQGAVTEGTEVEDVGPGTAEQHVGPLLARQVVVAVPAVEPVVVRPAHQQVVGWPRSRGGRCPNRRGGPRYPCRWSGRGATY